MLEEALNSAEYPPGETALALLSFLRYELPAGGSAAEVRFCRLFPLICCRVFGALSEETHEFDYGGWLSLQKRWNFQPEPNNVNYSSSKLKNATTSLTSSASSSSTVTYNMDPVVQLLSLSNISSSPQKVSHQQSGLIQIENYNSSVTLLDAISTETILRPDVRFAFPVSAFDTSLQKAFMKQIEFAKRCLAESSPTYMNSSPFFSKPLGVSARTIHHENTHASQNTVQFDLDCHSNAIKLCQLILDNKKFNTTVAQSQEILQRLIPQQNNQSQQQQTQQKQSQQQHHQQQHFSPTGARPIITSPFHPSNQEPIYTPASTVIMLSMLEHYFVSFAKFPRSRKLQVEQQRKHVPSHSYTSSSNQNSTSHLYSIPTPGTSLKKRQKKISYGDSVYLYLLRSYLGKYLSYSPEKRYHQSLDHNSELFLRIMIEFWFEAENTPLPTSIALDRYYESKRRNTYGRDHVHESHLHHRLLTNNNSIPTVEAAYDLTIQIQQQGELSHFTQQSSATTRLMQRSIRSLVIHLISDPNLYLRIQDGLTYAKSVGDDMNMNMDSAVMGSLTPQMSIVQPSFYNYVRVAFKYSPTHLDDSAFYTALNLWLIWLEPWNVTLSRKFDARKITTESAKSVIQQFLPNNPNKASSKIMATSNENKNASKAPADPSRISFPRIDTPSKYTIEKWEPYVAANLHLYLFPLAIFLKRAKEFDFSTPHFHKSLGHVQRVLRVFSPLLVKTIHKLTSNGNKCKSDNSFSNANVDDYLLLLKKNHEENLGCYCPPISNFSNCAPSSPSVNFNDTSNAPTNNPVDTKYASISHPYHCYADAQALLEELHFQQRKKIRELFIFDRLVAKFEGFFGSGVMQGNEHAIQKTVSRLQNILGLPEDFDFFSKHVSSVEDNGDVRRRSDSIGLPERTTDGYLTQRGREEVFTGLYKCGTLEMAEYLTKKNSNTLDPMENIIKSYEVPLLVHLCNSCSLWLNEKLGLNNDEDNRGTWIKIITYCLLFFFDEDELDSFHINLRFLADYRIFIWIGLFGSITWGLIM